MSLTSDFKVRDSLFVSQSGLFLAGTTSGFTSDVAIDSRGKILSGGRDLSQIFQEIDLELLTNGPGINSFVYDGDSSATVSISGFDSLTNGSIVVFDQSGGLIDAEINDNQLNSLYTNYNSNSANIVNNSSSPSQGTLTFNRQDGSSFNVDTGLQTSDSPSFNSLILFDNLTVQNDSILGQAISDSVTINGSTITLNNLPAGTSNDVVTINSSNELVYDQINSKVWQTTIDLVDSTGTANYIPKFTDADTIENSIMQESGNQINVGGDLFITGNLSAAGQFTQVDTLVNVTSALTITNAGTGPALTVEQSGVQPIAVFNDSDNNQAITISNDGNIGVNISSPSSDLHVVGTTTLSGDTTIYTSNLVIDEPSQVSNETTVVLLDSGNKVVTDEIDPRVFDDSLIGGDGTANTLAKFSSSDTMVDSSISDDGTTITADGDVVLTSENYFELNSTTGVDTNTSRTQAFTESLTSSLANTVVTFDKTNLSTAKYTVTLATGGALRTAFEILAVHNGTDVFGTVYAIVDAQANTLLTQIDVDSSGSTIDLLITPSSNCTAFIYGTAHYL